MCVCVHMSWCTHVVIPISMCVRVCARAGCTRGMVQAFHMDKRLRCVCVCVLCVCGPFGTGLHVYVCVCVSPHRVGKMLVYGAMLGCLDPVLTIAAAMAHGRPVFATPPPDQQAQVAAARRGLVAAGVESRSDHVALVAAYNEWARRAACEWNTHTHTLHKHRLLLHLTTYTCLCEARCIAARGHKGACACLCVGCLAGCKVKETWKDPSCACVCV